MRRDNAEQRAAERQRIQDQLDNLAKQRGYTKFTLETVEAKVNPITQRLRSPRTGFEKRQRLPRPHSAAAKPVARQETFLEHDSHRKATELLEPYREDLGAAYLTIHFIVRWSVEHATEQDPAPHLMTCYWTLEEALGQSERNIRRHLIEDGHRWSATVKYLIDLRHNYGELLDGKDDQGNDKTRPVITSTVIRFFPKGRLSDRARVKRWGRRDLLTDSDEGRTRPTRQSVQNTRYRRKNGLMSGYSSVKEQYQDFNWLMVKLGQTVSERSDEQNSKNYGSLYADIPKNHVLDALRSDLHQALEDTQERGGSITRARTKWVDMAAQVLAQRHHDDKPLPHHSSTKHVTHFDGFTDLWRMVLWTAVKAELYGGTTRGWTLVRRMVTLAGEGLESGVAKPSAWAWVQVREEVVALRRDYGSGLAGLLGAGESCP